jgi:hypothetical protein
VAGYAPPQLDTSGQAMRSAGAEVQQAADIIAATNARQDAMVAQSSLNSLQSSMVSLEFDTQKGFRNAKEGAAVGQPFLETYQQQFEDVRKKARDGLANDSQRRVFDQHAEVHSMRFRASLLRHQAEQTERFNDSTDNASLENALQGIAVNPGNEGLFQAGVVAIESTVDGMAARKGLPAQQAKALKLKFIDAAYSTRITSILQGIPGVQKADPYKAEEMFKQVQDRLGVQSQVHLARVVQKGVQEVQARDFGQAMIYGRAPLKPQDVAPAIAGIPLAGAKDLTPIVRHLETGGLADPEAAVSPAGARGPMQVMPGTSTDPGFGVRPAQVGADGKVLPGELERVGRDYLGAMVARYDHPALVLAAYNAGPGRADQWIRQLGDPRAGQVSVEEWATKIPFKETRDYVIKGLRMLAEKGGAPDMPVAAPTANQLKIDLHERVNYARQWAEQAYPGDAAFADAVASRVASYGQQVISGQIAREAGARDGLIQGMIGQRPDGSDAPQTIDQLLADPTMRRNWEAAAPDVKQGIQRHFAVGDKAEKWNPDAFRNYYRLIGEATSDPEAFAARDLSNVFGMMPMAGINHLTNMQASLRTREARDANKANSYLHAQALVESMLKPLKMGRSAKDTSKKEDTDVFYGMLQEAMEDFKKTTGKRPQDADITRIATGLLAQGQTPGSLFGGFWPNDTPAFKAAREGKLQGYAVPLPADATLRSEIASQFNAAHGRVLSGAELQAEYTKYRLAGGKDPIPRPTSSAAPRRKVSGVVTEGQ